MENTRHGVFAADYSTTSALPEICTYWRILTKCFENKNAVLKIVCIFLLTCRRVHNLLYYNSYICGFDIHTPVMYMHFRYFNISVWISI